MSSHHFVKEGQEPALFILEALGLELIEPLLEWAPLVVVADGALDEVLRWGIKVDVVLSAVDKVQENQQKVMDQEPVRIIPYLPENDLRQSGILFLIDHQQQAVNLIANLSEELFRLSEIFPQFKIVLIDRQMKWTYHAANFLKWLPEKSKIQIRKSSSHQTMIAHGLLQSDGQAETLQDGLVKIQSAQPFWVGESVL